MIYSLKVTRLLKRLRMFWYLKYRCDFQTFCIDYCLYVTWRKLPFITHLVMKGNHFNMILKRDSVLSSGYQFCFPCLGCCSVLWISDFSTKTHKKKNDERTFKCLSGIDAVRVSCAEKLIAGKIQTWLQWLSSVLTDSNCRQDDSTLPWADLSHPVRERQQLSAADGLSPGHITTVWMEFVSQLLSWVLTLSLLSSGIYPCLNLCRETSVNMCNALQEQN